MIVKKNLFQDGVAYDSVCRKCWWKVEDFHEFYTRIENVHNPVHGRESIFVEGIPTEDELSTKNTKLQSKIKLEPDDSFDYDNECISDKFLSNNDELNQLNVSSHVEDNTPKKESKKHVKDSKDQSKDTGDSGLTKKSASTAPLSYQLV